MFLDSLSESNLDFDFDDNFNDALIESAVEMEAAYYDFVTESCQIKFQEISESASVEALNEGVIDAIKNFFKKIWNAITKLFGGSGSSSGGGSGSSGGIGASSSPHKEIKMTNQFLDFMAKNKAAIDAHAAEAADTFQISYCPVDTKAFVPVDNSLYSKFDSVASTFYGDEYTTNSNEDSQKTTCKAICKYIFPHLPVADNIDAIRNAYNNCFKKMTVKEFGAKYGVSMDYSGLSSAIKDCIVFDKEFNEAKASIKKFLKVQEKKLTDSANKNNGNCSKQIRGISTLCTVLTMLAATHRRTIQGIKKQIKLTVKKAVKANN